MYGPNEVEFGPIYNFDTTSSQGSPVSAKRQRLNELGPRKVMFNEENNEVVEIPR